MRQIESERTQCQVVQGRFWCWGPAGLLALILVVAMADTARAGDYDDKTLSLRLGSAFVRFTEVSTFGGESAANRWSPAVNPASADWTKLPGRKGIALAPYYQHISFDSGTLLDLYAAAGAWDTKRAGTFVPTVSAIRSNDVADRTGLGFDYETDTVQLLWGKRLHSFGVGASANYNETRVRQTAGTITVRESSASTWRFRVGGLYEPRCKWLVGLVAEYANSPYDYDAVVQTPGGLFPISGSDTFEHYIVRAGLSYEYKPLSTAYTDLQFARFEDQTGRLDVWRLQAGVQHRVHPALWLRGAATTDQYGNVGGMVGLTAAFARWGQFHFGYQRGVLPELVPNFGQSDIFQFTLSFNL